MQSKEYLRSSRRLWPQHYGHIYVCGDTRDFNYPAAMAGARYSGKASVLLIAEDL